MSCFCPFGRPKKSVFRNCSPLKVIWQHKLPCLGHKQTRNDKFQLANLVGCGHPGAMCWSPPGVIPLHSSARIVHCAFCLVWIALSLEISTFLRGFSLRQNVLGCRDYVNWCLFGGMSGGGTRTAPISTGFKLGKKFRDIIHISCNSIQSEIN